jgi:hypothetical protein
MDPINPWLDPTEVRRLAERLLYPAHESAMTATDAGFDEAFIGYATPHATQPPTPPPVKETGDESPHDRIIRFRDWMREHFSATGVFILDHKGTVIFDESSHGRLHFFARSLALASRRPAASLSNVRIKIGAGSILEIIPLETVHGDLVLGAVVPDALDSISVARIMAALSTVTQLPADN